MAKMVGMLRVESNAEMVEREQAEAQVKAAESAEAQAAVVVDHLAAQCWSEFTRARDAKVEIENLMFADLRARKAIYDSSTRAMINEIGGSDSYLQLTQQRCRLAISWLQSIFLRDRPFACKPTPIPDVPPPLMQRIEQECIAELQRASIDYQAVGPQALRERVEAVADRIKAEAKQWAQRRATFNEDQIDDELREGGFYEALMQFIDDLVGSRGGFIKGPTIRRRRKLKWSPDGLSMEVTNEPVRTYTAPSGFDMYPGPGVCEIDDGTLSERIRLSRTELYDLIGVDGFREDKIREALAKYDTGGLKGWWWGDAQRANLEGRPQGFAVTSVLDGDFDCIEHYTVCTGQRLVDWGVPRAEVGDLEKPYPVTVWLIGQDCVVGVRINDDPLGRRPYFKAGFSYVRGSFWYEGVPALLADLQAMCNAAARSLANNMAMSDGYITELQVDRLAAGETAKRPEPRTVLQTVAPRNGTAGPAVYFHQPQSNAQLYLSVITYFSRLADEYLGLPSFMGGTPTTTGAAGTSSGLSQLTQMATRAFEYVIIQVDNVIDGVASATHVDMLRFPEVRHSGPHNWMRMTGDLRIEAKGTRSLLTKEQRQVRLNELVRDLANPFDAPIMGAAGRAELIRAALDGFDNIDLDLVLPNRDQLLAQARAAMAQSVGMPGQQPGAAPRAALPDGSVAGGADQGAPP